MITNRVSTTISPDAQQHVMAAIATIRENLPFLLDLGNIEHSVCKSRDENGIGRSRQAIRPPLRGAAGRAARSPQHRLIALRRVREPPAVMPVLRAAI